MPPEPQTPIRDDNGHTPFPPQRRWADGTLLSAFISTLVPSVIAVTCTALVTWFTLSAEVRQLTVAQAEQKKAIAELAADKEAKSVQYAQLAERLEAVVNRLDEAIKRLERAEDKR